MKTSIPRVLLTFALICFAFLPKAQAVVPPPDGGYYLDHDQRNTLAAGVDGSLPWRTFVAVSLNYGSGILNENGPAHLPGHTKFDLSFCKPVGAILSVRVRGWNL